VGILLSIATIVAAFRQVIFGMLSDMVGRKTFFILGAICTTIRLIVFATKSDFWYLALGQAVGVSNFFRMTLRSLAPTLAGYMFEMVSISLPFISGSILVIINAGLYRNFYSCIDTEGEMLLED
jgi:MFS family permease